MDSPRLKISFAVLILCLHSMCKAYDMYKDECVKPILFASRKLYMTSASTQFSACYSFKIYQVTIRSIYRTNKRSINKWHKVYKLCSLDKRGTKCKQYYEVSIHIPTKLLGNVDPPCIVLHAKKCGRIVHKSQLVLSSHLQEGKPPEPIWCTFKIPKNKIQCT